MADFALFQQLLRVCYSVKTNPSMRVLREATKAKFLAEVISPAEFDHALLCGFAPEDIVYNGPYLRQPAADAPRTFSPIRSKASPFRAAALGEASSASACFYRGRSKQLNPDLGSALAANLGCAYSAEMRSKGTEGVAIECESRRFSYAR
ncbi:MAG: hypothetical protein WCC84_12935 [Candidatus Cybelea sp.]